MGVHRGAIREAIKRLQQARLVAVAHGGGTRVLNWRETGGVEILPDLVKGIAEEPAPDVVQSVLEARRGIGIDIARLCAQRAASGFAARLHDHLDRDPDTEDTQLNAYLDLWELITHGSDNIAYQLIFRSVRDALEPLGDIIAPLLADETSDTITQRALIDAIAQRKPERAASIADELLSRTLENLQQHPNIAPSPAKKS